MPRNPSATAQIASLRLEISGLRAVNGILLRRQGLLRAQLADVQEGNKGLIREIKTLREWCSVPGLTQALAAATKARDDACFRAARLSEKLSKIVALSSEPI